MKSFLVVAILLLTVGNLSAQINDPTTWTYSVKHLKGNNYQVVYHVSLTKGWHIFSQKPGDESLIPPSFKLSKGSGVTPVGKLQERGTLKVEKIEGFDNTINYYEGEVDFIQKVAVKGKVLSIKGEHEYQVCNDKMCLPPRTKEFSIKIKD